MGSGRVFAAVAVAGLVGSTAGCAHKVPPDKLCAAGEDRVAGVVLDRAQAMAPVDRAQAVDAELDRMRRERMLGFDSVSGVLEGDGTLRCAGRLRLHLDVDDQTAEDQATLGQRGGGASNTTGDAGAGQIESGQSLAAGLASSSAAAQVAFVRQPGDSPGVFTYTVGDTAGLAARLVKIAADLSASRSAKATPLAFSGPGALQVNSLSAADLGPNPAGDNDTDDTTPLPAFPR